MFFKCHYDYDPANDNLIPCKEAGLRFETGDILQIVNQDDVNWWQVEYRSSMCAIFTSLCCFEDSTADRKQIQIFFRFKCLL